MKTTILAVTFDNQIEICDINDIINKKSSNSCKYIDYQKENETPQEFLERIEYSCDKNKFIELKILEYNPYLSKEEVHNATEYVRNNFKIKNHDFNKNCNNNIICPYCSVGFKKYNNSISHIATCKKKNVLNEAIKSGKTILEIINEFNLEKDKEKIKLLDDSNPKDAEILKFLNMNKEQFMDFIKETKIKKRFAYFYFSNKNDFRSNYFNFYIDRLCFVFGIYISTYSINFKKDDTIINSVKLLIKNLEKFNK